MYNKVINYIKKIKNDNPEDLSLCEHQRRAVGKMMTVENKYYVESNFGFFTGPHPRGKLFCMLEFIKTKKTVRINSNLIFSMSIMKDALNKYLIKTTDLPTAICSMITMYTSLPELGRPCGNYVEPRIFKDSQSHWLMSYYRRDDIFVDTTLFIVNDHTYRPIHKIHKRYFSEMKVLSVATIKQYEMFVEASVNTLQSYDFIVILSCFASPFFYAHRRYRFTRVVTNYLTRPIYSYVTRIAVPLANFTWFVGTDAFCSTKFSYSVLHSMKTVDCNIFQQYTINRKTISPIKIKLTYFEGMVDTTTFKKKENVCKYFFGTQCNILNKNNNILLLVNRIMDIQNIIEKIHACKRKEILILSNPSQNKASRIRNKKVIIMTKNMVLDKIDFTHITHLFNISDLDNYDTFCGCTSKGCRLWDRSYYRPWIDLCLGYNRTKPLYVFHYKPKIFGMNNSLI